MFQFNPAQVQLLDFVRFYGTAKGLRDSEAAYDLWLQIEQSLSKLGTEVAPDPTRSLPSGPLSSRLRADVECAPWILNEIKALEQQLARERERLDWIARQADEFSSEIMVDMPGDGDYAVSGMDGQFGTGPTFREALDAARTSISTDKEKK